MAGPTLVPLPRRRFLVKPRYQVRLAAYPIAFLAVVLTAVGLSLHQHLGDSLRLHLSSPHIPLHNPWQVVAPALQRAATWGAGGYLGALAAWVWRCHTVLRSDLDGLADWMEQLGRERRRTGPLPALKDRDVAALGASLFRAAVVFDALEEDLESKSRALSSAATRAAGNSAARREGLREVRQAWEEVCRSCAAMGLDEDLR